MKKLVWLFLLGSLVLLFLNTTAWAQYEKRQDVIWARSVDGAAITMDGKLNEAVWAQAESLTVDYETEDALPTSASRPEFQPEANLDPTHATVKFLVDGNILWLGFYIPDSSIGGTQDWARWDGLLMSFKDRRSADRPTPPLEFFYTWWYANVDSLIGPGTPPMFRGAFEDVSDTARTAAQRAVWDGRTYVEGTSNDDSSPDQYWSVELRINLDSLGYDVTKPDGEIVEFNFSIWDEDWVWAGDPLKVSATRTWWQSPWNANADNVGRVFVRSDVTVNSGALPEVDPDVVVPNADAATAPVIDGVLDEEAWAGAYTFPIKFGDAAIRNAYPGVGPWRSGQFQPDLDNDGNTPLPQVLDSADATIKMFFRGHYLYLAADVNDQLVQGTNVFDQIDGVRFTIGDRVKVDGDNRMQFQQLRVNFTPSGADSAFEYLAQMLDSSDTEYALKLKGSTTVNDNTDVDEGYVIEMKVDLSYLGYPTDLGDHLLFMGVMLADGDSFDDPANNYGTRTWWFREHNGGPAAAWMVMDPNTTVGIRDGNAAMVANTVELFGNYPNPFNPSTHISYSIPQSGQVTLYVYNVLGERVLREDMGSKTRGVHEFQFNAQSLSSGLYFYKVELKGQASGKIMNSKVRKMALIK